MKHLNLTIITLLLIGCSETFESSYSDYESANILFESGWLPSWLPKTAIEIKEIHDIDTNAVSAMFNPNTNGLWKPKNCSKIYAYESQKPMLESSWWPMELQYNYYETPNYLFYKCGKYSYLAIQINGKEANYWSF